MIRIFLFCFILLITPIRAFADQAPNAVTDWSTIVQGVIHNATAPRSGGTSQILHTMVHLAVYDAVVAIEGGFTPYAANIQAPPGADVRAAVATAAYVTARPRLAESQRGIIDTHYVNYLATIADGQAKEDGIRVGRRAAEIMLALRANDGFSNVVLYECSTIPPPVGEFEPDGGCPATPTSPQPADAKVGLIEPFTLQSASQYRPSGPRALTSSEYTDDFFETRDYGRSDSALRSAEQTDIAYFWTEHPYVHWNRNLTNLAIVKGLDTRESARFFAMVHTAVADAVITGFEAKYFYSAWRPRTAIPLADYDGNPSTPGDPTWKPLVLVNHPEYPSGHGFWSTALLEAVTAFFGTHKVEWTLNTSKVAVPKLEQTERTYTSLKALMREIDDARVWSGLHWRHSMRHGAQIGRHVAKHVTKKFFRPIS